MTLVEPYEGLMPQMCLEPGSCKLVGIQRFGGEHLSLKYKLIITPVNSMIQFM